MYGAEAVILNLAHSFNEAGDTSVLGVFLNTVQPNLQLIERAHAEGLEVQRIRCRGQFDLGALKSIRAAIRFVDADVVHAHGYKADIYTWAALRRHRVPMVSTCHTWYDNDRFLRFYGAVDRRVLRHFQQVVAVSDEVKKRLLGSGLRPERIQQLRNGIETSPFAAIAAARIYRTSPGLHVGLVGRLAPEKGIDLFIRAAARVVQKLPSVRFSVFGEGAELEHLKHLVHELSFEPWLCFPGRQNNMPEVYAGLDLLVSASRQEGLPVALLEGMASGLPLVATAVGEVPSLLYQNTTGILVPPEDETTLAHAMHTLLTNVERRAASGRAGLALIEREYSATRMAEEYRIVYNAARNSLYGGPVCHG